MGEYTRLSERLGLKDSELAELHGTLAGLACSGLSPDGEAWTSFVAEHWETLTQEDRAELVASLFAQVEKDLAAGDLGFEPLLPDDGTDFFQRAQCLGFWCNGLLYGLAQVKPEWLGATETDIPEQLRDLSEIASRLTAIGEAFQPEEADEADLVEIHEYLRSLVQSLYFDLHQSPVRQPLLQ